MDVQFYLYLRVPHSILLQAAGTPNAIFNCLKENKDDADFDPNCRKLVVKRIVQQMKDYR